MKKTALITGASSGIGLELAKEFAINGVNLLLVARSTAKLESLAQELKKNYKIQVDFISKDLSKIDSSQEIFDWCKQNNTEVHFLINNAGFGDFGNFSESNWEKQLRMINLNITTLTHLTHLFLPNMIKNNYGKVLNVSSIAAFQPGPNMSVYFATKAFVLHFSEAISNELSNTNVTVTALCPGPTESGFQDAAQMQDSKLVKGKKFPSSKEVAQYGYKSMMDGKTVAIHGILNNIMVNTVRFTPRSWVLKLVRFIQDK
jgi:uncharacterized protein